MGDIARRILVRPSASPPECETECCFLFVISSPFIFFFFFPLPFVFPQILNRKHSSPLIGELFGLTSISSSFASILILGHFRFWPAFHPFFLSANPLSCSNPPFTSLPLLLTRSLPAKRCVHMVMIIPNILIFALLKHHSLFSPPTFLPLH